MNTDLTRRSLLRGLLGNGAAVYMGLPVLDALLDFNGIAYADGARLPIRFGTYFWGLGLTDTPAGTRWVPATWPGPPDCSSGGRPVRPRRRPRRRHWPDWR